MSPLCYSAIDFLRFCYYLFTYKHTKKRGLLLVNPCFAVLRKPVLSKLHAETHACISYIRIPTIGTRKCGYTHEHLLISCYRNRL